MWHSLSAAYIDKERSADGPSISHVLQHDRAPASRFASNGHLGGITAKLANVRLHPLKGKVLIEDSSIHHTVSVDFIG